MSQGTEKKKAQKCFLHNQKCFLLLNIAQHISRKPRKCSARPFLRSPSTCLLPSLCSAPGTGEGFIRCVTRHHFKGDPHTHNTQSIPYIHQKLNDMAHHIWPAEVNFPAPWPFCFCPCPCTDEPTLRCLFDASRLPIYSSPDLYSLVRSPGGQT